MGVEAGHTALFVTVRQCAESIERAGIPVWRQQARRYLQPRVLVIDEVGYTRLTPLQAQCLFDLVTLCYPYSKVPFLLDPISTRTAVN